MTKTIALDYAAKGITANTVPPFVIDTPMLRKQQAAANCHRLNIFQRRYQQAASDPLTTWQRCVRTCVPMVPATSRGR